MNMKVNEIRSKTFCGDLQTEIIWQITTDLKQEQLGPIRLQTVREKNVHMSFFILFMETSGFSSMSSRGFNYAVGAPWCG